MNVYGLRCRKRRLEAWHPEFQVTKRLESSFLQMEMALRCATRMPSRIRDWDSLSWGSNARLQVAWEGEARGSRIQNQPRLLKQVSKNRSKTTKKPFSVSHHRPATMPTSVPRGAPFLLLPPLLMLSAVLAVPLDRAAPHPEENQATESPDTGLYYHRYLQEVINVLETDGHFREKLQAANAEDIKSGKLSRELDFVSHHVRTKLDELKRQEVSRLRMLLKAKMDAQQEPNLQVDHLNLLKQFEHLDPQNQHTFEARDLELLIQTATRDLAQYDAAHHEEFKRYEMLKEHERRRYLESLGEEQRKEAERKLQEQQRRHREHPKVNVPGSQAQLKEVWEELDGLDPNRFNPKTFFILHGKVGRVFQN